MLLVAEGQKQISLSMELIQNLQDQSSDLQVLVAHGASSLLVHLSVYKRQFMIEEQLDFKLMLYFEHESENKPVI